MVEVFTVLGSFGTLVLLVDQVRRLIGHVVLNKTIRIAMEKDPKNVALLIKKIESRNPIPIGLIGCTILVVALMMMISLTLAESPDSDSWAIAVSAVVLGGALLAFDWWNRRRTRSTAP